MSKISVPRLYDFQLIELFLSLFEEDTKPPELNIEQISIGLGGDLSITLATDNIKECLEANKAILDHLADSQSHSILKITIIPRERKHLINYARIENSLLDYLEVTALNHYGIQGYTANDAIATSKIHSLILAKATQQPQSLSNEPENLSVRGEVLAQLQKLTSDVTRDQLEYRKTLDLEKEQFVVSERQRIEARLAELSHDYKLQSEQLEEKHRLQDEQLSAREQAVNDADNTTTRRATTANVLIDVREKAESFEFSRSVAKGRLLVLLLSLVVAAFGLGNAIIGTTYFSTSLSFAQNITNVNSQLSQKDYLAWFAFAKVFGGSFIFISSIVYLIRYQSQWTNRAANVELDYQKFSRDLNRAHVAIEMCLEWNAKKEGQIPETLLNAMTNGLFTENQGKVEEIMHPAEQLAAAMIKSAERIEFPIGSGKIITKGKNIPKSAQLPQ